MPANSSSGLSRPVTLSMHLNFGARDMLGFSGSCFNYAQPMTAQRGGPITQLFYLPNVPTMLEWVAYYLIYYSHKRPAPLQVGRNRRDYRTAEIRSEHYDCSTPMAPARHTVTI